MFAISKEMGDFEELLVTSKQCRPSICFCFRTLYMIVAARVAIMGMCLERTLVWGTAYGQCPELLVRRISFIFLLKKGRCHVLLSGKIGCEPACILYRGMSFIRKGSCHQYVVHARYASSLSVPKCVLRVSLFWLHFQTTVRPSETICSLFP